MDTCTCTCTTRDHGSSLKDFIGWVGTTTDVPENDHTVPYAQCNHLHRREAWGVCSRGYRTGLLVRRNRRVREMGWSARRQARLTRRLPGVLLPGALEREPVKVRVAQLREGLPR